MHSKLDQALQEFLQQDDGDSTHISIDEFGDRYREVYQIPEVRDMPFRLAVEANFLAGRKPLSKTDYFTDILIRLMDPEDLALLHSRCPIPAETTEPKIQEHHFKFQKWYFNAGHYKKGEELPGWEDFRREPYVNAYVDGRTGRPWEARMTHATRSDLCQQFNDVGVVGNSAEMLAVYEAAAQLAGYCRREPKQMPIVLIQGAPGTGKGEIAKAIHALGRGKKKPWRLVNTANLESVVETPFSRRDSCDPVS